MNKIPDFLNIYLKKNNLNFIELIQKSDWKKTYIIKVKKDNKYFILKAISANSPHEIKNKFRLEVLFYNNCKKKYIPKLIINNENILIIEYIESITLREYLIKNEYDIKIFNTLFDNINKLYIDNKIEFQENLSFNNAYTHLSALAQSGPIQTKDLEVSFFNKVTNKVIAKILKLKLKFLLNKIDTNKLKHGFVHGDFHYNNILIANNNIKFIDFENIKHNGFFDFDILYLFAMIEVYTQNNTEINRLYENELKNLIDGNKELFEVYKLYKTAISINKRFQVNIQC